MYIILFYNVLYDVILFVVGTGVVRGNWMQVWLCSEETVCSLNLESFLSMMISELRRCKPRAASQCL